MNIGKYPGRRDGRTEARDMAREKDNPVMDSLFPALFACHKNSPLDVKQEGAHEEDKDFFRDCGERR